MLERGSCEFSSGLLDPVGTMTGDDSNGNGDYSPPPEPSFWEWIVSDPWFGLLGVAYTVFHIWMMIDAARRGEWVWFVFMFIFPINSAVYYFSVYQYAAGGFTFEIPGAADRKRIAELEADIYNLDKAHHYQLLGDIYLKQGKHTKAEECYRSALERDKDELDAIAHLGICLAKQKKPAEALPYLKRAVEMNPKHDYGDTIMTLGEVLNELDEKAAMPVWKQALGYYSLPRARVQYAELLLKHGDKEEAKRMAKSVVADAPFTPKFQKWKDKPFVARAKKLLAVK